MIRALLALALLAAAPARAEGPVELVLWHSYPAAEGEALDATVATFNERHVGRVHVTTLFVPYDAYADKLTASIALGEGPDLFAFPGHDRTGDWSEQGLLAPIQYWMTDEIAARYPKSALEALTYPQGSRSLYGLPLAVKSVALVYDKARVPKPPATLDELEAEARRLTSGSSYGLAFDWGSTYTEAGFLHAFGGGVLDAKGNPTLDAPGNAAALAWVKKLRDEKLLPREITGALVQSLFNDGKAAMIVTGPWALKDLRIPTLAVAPLPAGPSGPASPFLGVDALYISSKGAHQREAFEAADYLAGDEAAKLRLERAEQPVPNRAVWKEARVNPALAGFREQAESAVPMPSAPAMRQVWIPMDAALSRIVGEGVAPKAGLAEAQRRVVASVKASQGEEPEGKGDAPLQGWETLTTTARDQAASRSVLRATMVNVGRFQRDAKGRWCGAVALASPTSATAAVQQGAALAGMCAGGELAAKPLSDLLDRAEGYGKPVTDRLFDMRFVAVVAGGVGGAAFVIDPPPGPPLTTWVLAALLAGLAFVLFWFRARLRPHLGAYAYVVPAVLALVVLVFVPFGYGLSLSLYDETPTRSRFVGLANFVDIFLARGAGDPHSFYYTLGVTILWTALNVFLHVGIGLFLALILQDPKLRLRKVYRSLLIIPWAIPNYITALIWKSMFNAEYGLINKVLGLHGFSWFEKPVTAFLANLATNVWLGFPFMMVVSLGALQSIPKELYEAAEVDGAGRWKKFTSVTLPLLKPALVPAVILGTIWTFNLSFNVIYLVSGGAPDGATDILVTQAFRYAFEQYRYGYAAAYATIIFAILLGYTMLTNRITKATEGAFE